MKRIFKKMQGFQAFMQTRRVVLTAGERLGGAGMTLMLMMIVIIIDMPRGPTPQGRRQLLAACKEVRRAKRRATLQRWATCEAAPERLPAEWRLLREQAVTRERRCSSRTASTRESKREAMRRAAKCATPPVSTGKEKKPEAARSRQRKKRKKKKEEKREAARSRQ